MHFRLFSKNIRVPSQTRYVSTAPSSEEAVKLRKQLRALPSVSVAAPKRAPTSYAIYVRENYSSGKDLKSLAREWKTLSQSEVRGFQEKAEKLKLKYKAELSEFLARRPASDFIIEKKRHELKEALRGKSLPKPFYLKQNAKAPTKAKSPYLIFYVSMVNGSEALQQKHLGRTLSGLSVPEKAKAVAAAWKSLSPRSKEAYESQAESQKKQYLELRDAYLKQNKTEELQKEISKLLKTAIKPVKKAVKKLAKKPVKKPAKKPKKKVSKKPKAKKLTKGKATKTTAKKASPKKKSVKAKV